MTSTPTNKTSDESILQEGIERSLREKLELELASKEREIAALVIDTQKLQSTLIKVKETSVTQVRRMEKSTFERLILRFTFRSLISKMFYRLKKNLLHNSKVNYIVKLITMKSNVN